jgi:hypothetical protein
MVWAILVGIQDIRFIVYSMALYCPSIYLETEENPDTSLRTVGAWSREEPYTFRTLVKSVIALANLPRTGDIKVKR